MATTNTVSEKALSQARNIARFRDVIIAPVVSEKSYAGFDQSLYTFVVSPTANKIEIRQAVEALFNVTVKDVRTHNRSGKRKRDRKTGTWGQRSNKKIAVVVLKDGDSIEVLGA
ncbi:MAG: 50S ribosomal protein L23 [Acidimicrobiia bacterium]|nr:50S ribosomal protein L23 [Acidimicrobiia bacterium]